MLCGVLCGARAVYEIALQWATSVSPCLRGTAAGLEMAAAVTCADVSTIEMMADRHVFRAAFMPASRPSSTSRRAALFPT